MKKQIWLLAGANGAGKSTFYYTRMKKMELPFINADEIGKKNFTKNGKTDGRKASEEAQRQVDEKLDQDESFCYETVFSHKSKIDILAKAKGLGYKINLIYIHLEIPELNVARVYQRVKMDGHAVPEDKIRSRIPRTMQNIKIALALVDDALILDNSETENPYKLVAEIQNSRLIFVQEPLEDWAQKILGIVDAS